MKEKIAGAFFILAILGGTLMHLITAWFFYSFHGFLVGFIAFCMPVFSALYLAGVTWAESGQILNGYNLIWVVIGLAYGIGQAIAESNAEKSEV